MRILTVTNMYPHPEHPAMGVFVQDQVRDVQELGHEVEVLVVEGWRSRWDYLAACHRVRRAVRTRSYDVLHVHYGLTGLPALCQREVPMVLSYCGSDLEVPWQRLISRWVNRYLQGRLVKSPTLLPLLGDPRAWVVPNGVNLEKFHPIPRAEARRRLGLPQKPVYIAFVANPARPEKRFDLAQQAVHLASASRPMELLVVHQRPHEEIPWYLNAADVVLLTSDYEGSPNIVKEAMACNRPIVATAVGDVPWLLEGVQGAAVVQHRPKEIARALVEVLEWRESNGRQRLQALGLDHRSVARKLVALYQEALRPVSRNREVSRETMGVDPVSGAWPLGPGHP